MIEFCPVGELRPMGKNVELKRFNKATENLNSVEVFMAGILYRFAMDGGCPAMFLKIPKKGDEPIDDMVYVEDFNYDRFKMLAKQMFDEANSFFGTDDILIYNLGEIVLLVKENFKEGDWIGYDTYVSGTEGTSIKRKCSQSTLLVRGK